jgi:glycosyltransferase involved in cell wall biosynthesis
MRIGVNCYLLQENIGGLRQYFHCLFRELLAHDDKNQYVFFYFERNGDEMAHLGNERWKEGALLLKDQEEVNHHLDKIDLYFCPFGALWPRPVPVPSVLTLVDIQEKYYPQFFTSQDLWNREYHFEGSTRASDQVITISEFSRDSIVHHHRLSKKKVHVCYLAADSIFYDPSESQEVSFKLPEAYIYYPANRWLHKNHDNLLKALVVLKNQYHVEIPCVLTGFDYENGYPLKEKLAEYGLEKQIVILGYVNKHEIKYVYQNARLLCFPSLFEGFGMPLVEAMATGCPVVCSNVTSIPEVAGKAALFFDPEDPQDIAAQMNRVLTDEALRKNLILLGKDQAKQFSPQKIAQRHLEVFSLALRSYRRPRYLYYKYISEARHRNKMNKKLKHLQGQ